VVCLVKFLKGIKKSVRKRLTAKQKESFLTIYNTYFYAIDGFASGNPTKLQRLAMRYYVSKSIDSTYNKIAKKRCVVLSRKKKLTPKDIEFVDIELREYVQASLWKDLQMLESDLSLDEKKVEKAFKRNEKNKQAFGKAKVLEAVKSVRKQK